MRQIYYAHHKFKYNTLVEKYELDLIKSKFQDTPIFNPNGMIKTKGKTEEQIMNDCFMAVKNSDIIVFSSMDGVIGMGVYQEVSLALQEGKEVFYIHKNQVGKVKRINFNIINESFRVYAIVEVECY